MKINSKFTKYIDNEDHCHQNDDISGSSKIHCQAQDSKNISNNRVHRIHIHANHQNLELFHNIYHKCYDMKDSRDARNLLMVQNLKNSVLCRNHYMGINVRNTNARNIASK